MQLNWQHVVIYNIIAASILVLGFLLKQNIMISIGCIIEFAQSLPIVLWIVGKMFNDDEPLYNNKGKVIGKIQNDDDVS